jgi:hypothetical protein
VSVSGAIVRSTLWIQRLPRGSGIAPERSQNSSPTKIMSISTSCSPSNASRPSMTPREPSAVETPVPAHENAPWPALRSTSTATTASTRPGTPPRCALSMR